MRRELGDGMAAPSAAIGCHRRRGCGHSSKRCKLQPQQPPRCDAELRRRAERKAAHLLRLTRQRASSFPRSPALLMLVCVAPRVFPPPPPANTNKAPRALVSWKTLRTIKNMFFEGLSIVVPQSLCGKTIPDRRPLDKDTSKIPTKAFQQVQHQKKGEGKHWK